MKNITSGIGFWLLSSLCLVQAAEPAPALELKTLQGMTSHLADHKGQVVYLDFWATWCAPCRQSFPWMNEMHDKYKTQGLKIIAISLDEKTEQVEGFLQTLPAHFSIMIDSEGKSADLFKVRGMPSSYVIDRNGNIVGSHAGFRQKDTIKLEQMIKQALAS